MGKQFALQELIRTGSTNKVDVVLLCETWLRKETKGNIHIPGFVFIGKERIGNKGGGVDILVSDSLKKERRRRELEIDNSVFENICIEIEGNKDNLLLCSGYRALNTSQKEFTETYKEFLTTMNSVKQQCFIRLDHNLDLLKCTTSKYLQIFLEHNLERNLLTCITKPTRLTHHSATLIDNILCSHDAHTDHVSFLLTTDISDHLPCVGIFPDLFPTKLEPALIKKRILTKKKVEKIYDELHQTDWANLLSCHDCESKFDLLHTKILDSMNLHAPEKITKMKEKNITAPWLSKGILRSMKKQQKLYKKTLNVMNENITTDSVGTYKKYRSTLQ